MTETMRKLTVFGIPAAERKRLFDSLSNDERRAIEAEWKQLTFEERAQATFDIIPKENKNMRNLRYCDIPIPALKELHQAFRKDEMQGIAPLGGYIYDAVILEKKYHYPQV